MRRLFSLSLPIFSMVFRHKYTEEEINNHSRRVSYPMIGRFELEMVEIETCSSDKREAYYRSSIVWDAPLDFQVDFKLIEERCAAIDEYYKRLGK